MFKNLIIFFMAVFAGLFSRAAETSMVPNSIVDADRNAEAMVAMLNSGRRIYLNGKTYYVGASKSKIHRNIYIKGPGTIITTTGNNFYIDAPVSIKIVGATFKTTRTISSGVQNRFIVNDGINYHRSLVVKDCTISGVRIFTHVASDVDQVNTEDGVQNVLFTNNTVSDIGDYILLLTNCKSEKVRIENNTLSRLYVMGFGLGVDNSYQELAFARMKKVFFRNNRIDNKGLIIEDKDIFGSTYMTPILCEADYCLCEGNEINNILAAKHQPIALYPFYLSCREVVIRNNRIKDCIHLSDSRYNEMFKCKGGQGSPKNRRIENNSYIITKECLSLVPRGDGMPIISFTGFQNSNMGNVVIRDNNVSLACDFVFGAGSMCSYKSYLFENNLITYNDAGSSAQQLLRLKPALSEGSKIIVRDNVMNQTQPVKDVYGLFLGDCSGYSFEITNNKFSGCLPTGEDDIDPTSPVSFVSKGNRIDLGKSHSVVRISRNVNCDDVFTGGDNYTMYIYPSDIMNGRLRFKFEGTSPANIMTFTRMPQAGSCDVSVSDGKEVKKYSCGVDSANLYIKEYDGGTSKTISKGKKVAKEYVGKIKDNFGRMISDGEMIYYSTPPTAKGDITVEIKYNTHSNTTRDGSISRR